MFSKVKSAAIDWKGTGVFFLALVAWWGWMPLVAFIGWCLGNWITPGMGDWHLFFNQLMNVWLFQDTAVFYLWLTFGIIGTLIIAVSFAVEDDLDDVIASGVCVVSVIALVWSIAGYVVRVWDADKDQARWWNSANVFVVPDLNSSPSSFTKILTGTNLKSDRKGCTLSGPKSNGDTPDISTCIVQGTYPMQGWEPRVSSLDGALKVLTRSSGNTAGVSLDDNSVEYLNTRNNSTPVWSGVLDGSGKSNPMEGVATWDGRRPKPDMCPFNGADRAVHGSRGNSLPNILNDRFPALQFHYGEYWGYCSGVGTERYTSGPKSGELKQPGEAVVVFPVTRQLGWEHSFVDAPAGVVVVKGGGKRFQYQYIPDVKRGQFPGPVYAASVVDHQITDSAWAGGRRIKDNNHFGYAPTDAQSQEANNKDYLLESKIDHHLYWVTPLTASNSTSQLFTAYSVTPADEVHENRLNTDKIYVLNDNDPRVVNPDQMEAVAVQAIKDRNPGFFSGSGSQEGTLLEFIPQGGDEFRAYGEQNGRVVYRVDVDASSQVATSVVELNGNGADTTGPGAGSSPTDGGGATPPTGVNCNDVTKLSNSQLVSCANADLAELAKREAGH